MKKRWMLLFLAVTALVVAQVAWWATLFVRETDAAAQLKLENLALRSQMGQPVYTSREAILKEAYHRRVMFLSETSFFLLLTAVGLLLIYHALRAEARSREIEKNFIATVTHESKTPMTALKLRLESVRDKWGQEPGLAKELGLALDEVLRLVRIFDKMMGLHRLERQALERQLVSLGEIAEEVARRLEPFFRMHGTAFSLHCSQEVWVNADAEELGNAIQCLLENAVLYNDKADKRVVLALKEEYGIAVVSVTDNGPGIPREDRGRVFERFYRGQRGKRVPGTGLGLTIAHSIAVAHQGTLKLAATGAEGTRFEIELPAVKA